MPSKKYLDLKKLAREEGHARFGRDSEEKKAKRITRAEKDILYFGRTYLPHYLSKPSAAFHAEILKLVLKFSRLALGAPRGHAKSTIISLLYPLWCICFLKKRFIVLGSDTAGQAEDFLDDIRIEIEENEKIKGDFGDLVGRRKWTGKQFVTNSGAIVMAIGTGSQTRGLRKRQYRPDLIILDDPQNDENVMSLQQRNKDERWLKRSLSNCLNPDGGQLIVLATMIHHDCLLKRLEKVKAYKYKIYRAIDEHGKALWPAMFPLKKLLKIRDEEIGSIAFNAEFLNDPVPEDEARPFNPEWFKYYKEEDVTGISMDYYAGYDPSVAKKETADYMSLIIIGISKIDGRIFIRSADIKRITPKQQIKLICERFAQYNYLLVGIETVAFQDVVKDWLDEYSTEKRYYLPTTEIKHSSDKVRRIMRLSPLFEQGIVYLKEDMTLLIDQLQYFPNAGYDDGPDALEMAIDIARNRGRQFEIYQEPVEEGVFLI